MSIGVLPTPIFQTGGFSRHPSTMENPKPIATVDQEIATVESTDEAGTVPQDVQTVARPHLLTLWYSPDTPAKLSDKLPTTRLQKQGQETFVMGRGQDLDVLLNDEHMPRMFVEVYCRVEEDIPKWYVKNLSDKKAVRLELGVNRATVKFNEVKELQDRQKLKLETLCLTVRTEEGDYAENTEFQLEFRASDSFLSSSGSYKRQTSSSTDSSGSVFSASELGRQPYGSSPVLNGQYMTFGHFGQIPPSGPVPRAGPVLPGVYPPGQVAASRMPMHQGGAGAMVYYPVTTAGSLPGFGPHFPAGQPHLPLANPAYGRQECYEHRPDVPGCYPGGYSGQVSAVLPPQSHPPSALGSHGADPHSGPGPHSGSESHGLGAPGPYYGATGPAPYHAVPNRIPSHYSGAGAFGPPGSSPSPGTGNHPGSNPYPGTGNHPGSNPYPGTGNHPGVNPYPGTGNHPGVNPYPGTGNHPGSNPYPGTGNHPRVNPYPGTGNPPGSNPYPGTGNPPGSNPYPGTGSHPGPTAYSERNANFFNAPAGGGGVRGGDPAGLGPVPPGQSSVPPGNWGPQDHQPVNQPAGVTGVNQQSPAAQQRLREEEKHGASRGGETGMSELMSHGPASVNSSALASHPDGQHASTSQSMSMQFPTLMSREHQVFQHYNPEEFLPCHQHQYHHQQQQQQQPLLAQAGPLHGPLSVPPQHYSGMSSLSQGDVYAQGAYGRQAVTRPPHIIAQPESAVVHQQPESARLHNPEQPESARVHNMSGQQPESARLHDPEQLESARVRNMSGQQPESAQGVHNAFGHQPESSAEYSMSGQYRESPHSTLIQQASDASRHTTATLLGTSAPARYPPSRSPPAAPPVSQLSGMTLSSPAQATTPSPSERMSPTPANSLHRDHPEIVTGVASGVRLNYTAPTTQAFSWQGPGAQASTQAEAAGVANERNPGGSVYDQPRRRSDPVSGSGGGPAYVLPSGVAMAPVPNLPGFPRQILPAIAAQTYSAVQAEQNGHSRQMPLAARAPVPTSVLSRSAPNGNQIHLRNHDVMMAQPSMPPSSDFSSQGSTRVQDLQAVVSQSSLVHTRQPQENDERQPQEHEEEEENGAM